MRTTLDISDDAYQIAKTVAREQHRSLGSVVSDFITGQFDNVAQSAVSPTEKDEVFPTFRSDRRTTNEDVIRARDDDE
ncbi:MAG: hypothetical protein ABIR70_12275 [Bryobacteraceae bacterium]